MAASKFCSHHDKRHPISAFGKHRGHGDGFDSICLAAMREKRRALERAKRPIKFPDPKEGPPELTEQTPEAFFRFFERFSGLGAVPDHAKAWVDAAMREDNLILNVPSKHAKTTIMAEWFSIWQLCCNRQAQVLLISKTQPLAIRSARRIASVLEFHPDLNMTFGRFVSEEQGWPWRPEQGELMVAGRDRLVGTGDLSLQARGSQQQVLGMEATLLIADDITDRPIAQSEAGSKRELEWFRGECLSRLVGDKDPDKPIGKALLVGQRVHAQDIYAKLLDPEEDDEGGVRTWAHEVYPAVLDWGDKDKEPTLLWPQVRGGLRWIKAQRRRLGADLFAAYFQQAPTPEGAGGIREEWIQDCLDSERGLGESQFQPRERVRVISVDPSPSRYAGIIVADIVEGVQPVIHVLEVRRELDVGVDGLLGVLAGLQLKYGADACIVEMNSLRIIARDSTFRQLSDLFDNRLIRHSTTAVSKQNETLGLWTMSSAWEFGRIRLPYGSPAAKESSDLLIREALGYLPTDDLVMATWFIFYNIHFLKHYRRGAFSNHVNWNPGAGSGWGPQRGWGPAFGDKVSVSA